jgi:hypothetical protein
MTETIHFIIAAIVICEVVAITGSTLEDIAKDLVLRSAARKRRKAKAPLLPSKGTT